MGLKTLNEKADYFRVFVVDEVGQWCRARLKAELVAKIGDCNYLLSNVLK